MNQRHANYQRTQQRDRGFSMIDVLVSIIVMATALLALALLQGTLTRNTADARSRSLLAQVGEGLIEQARQSGYTGLANATITPVAPTSPASCTNTNVAGFSKGNTLYCAQKAAGVSNLSVAQTVATYTYSNPTQPGGTGCTGKFVAGTGGTCANSQTAAYKDLTQVTSWTDASGTARSVTQHTIVSSLALDSGQGLQNNNNYVGSVTTPVVRQISPVVPGVIPIAIGANTDTAATNPRPEVSSTNANATSYNVLTYKDLSTQVQIQQRVETVIIGCSCQYSKQITTGVFAPAWRPTYWDGTHYVEPQPYYVASSNTSGTASPAGQNPAAASFTNPPSPLCTYCCRDHHDFDNDVANPDPSDTSNPAITDPVKYDPFRIAQGDTAHTHYYWDTSSTPAKFTPADNSHPYLEACRMIRVNGLWRTATDLNAEQVGFVATDSQANTGLPTTPTSSQPGTSWIPSGTAEAGYQNFVTDYFDQKIVQGASPNAGTVYHSWLLDDPSQLVYSGTKEYLHVRGLYLDNIEAPAQQKITSAISHCAGSKIGCVLPYIPFTSINLTELAFWGSPNPGLGVSSVGTSPLKANLSVTNAGTLTGDFSSNPPKSGTVNNGGGGGNQDDILVKITASNSGVSAGVPGPGGTVGSTNQSIDGKDAVFVAHYSGDPALVGNPSPAPAYTDMQHFKVRANPGDSFTVNAIGVTAADLVQVLDSSTSNDPTISWYTTDLSDSSDCGASYDQTGPNPNPYGCYTDLSLTKPSPPTTGPDLQLWITHYNYVKYVSEADPCDPAAAQVPHPYCEYETVTEVDVGSPGVALVPQPAFSLTNAGKVSEITKFTLPSVIANGVYTVKFGNHSETAATANACTIDANGGSHFAGWAALPCQ